jgi:flagellar protein FlaG
MDVGMINSANIAAKMDSVKTELHITPLVTSGSKEVELQRTSSVQAVTEAQEDKPAPEKEAPKDLNKVAEELTDMLAMMKKGLTFSVDDDSGRQVISVKDTVSGDIIRQIPSEEALELADKLSEFTGLLTKTQA